MPKKAPDRHQQNQDPRRGTVAREVWLARLAAALTAVWVAAVVLCFAIEGTFRGPTIPILLAVCILLCMGATVWLVESALHRLNTARPLVAPTGEINVECPACGYSMVGLDQCRCPECGAEYTIDDLIRRQGYGVLRFGRPAAETDEEPASRAVDGGLKGPSVRDP